MMLSSSYLLGESSKRLDAPLKSDIIISLKQSYNNNNADDDNNGRDNKASQQRALADAAEGRPLERR